MCAQLFRESDPGAVADGACRCAAAEGAVRTLGLPWEQRAGVHSRRPGRFRLAGLVLIVTGCLSSSAVGGYLPMVGPSPLRFEPRLPRVAIVPEPQAVPVEPISRQPAVAPVPVIDPAVTGSSETNAPEAEFVVTTAGSPVAVGLEPEEGAGGGPPPSEPGVAGGGANGPVTPQMMLHFFQHEGGRARTTRGISVPATFVPPVLPAPPPSRALLVRPEENVPASSPPGGNAE